MSRKLKLTDSLWLGIDIGTSSVKAVLINFDGDTILSKSLPTMSEVKSGIGCSGYEQNPQKCLKTVHDLVLPLIEKEKHRINGIGVTGQMHGVVFWHKSKDKIESLECIDESLSSNLYTWQDQRCSSEFLEALPKWGSSLQCLSTGYGCATMFWLARNHPTFFRDGEYCSCGTIMDFLVAILCDIDHPVTSDQLAASLGYFDETTLGWSSVLQDVDEFPLHLLPKVVAAGTQVGEVCASLNGWPAGVPVFVGMGDVQCAMYDVLKNTSDAAVNISTSIQLGFVVPGHELELVQQQSPSSISYFPYFNGNKLALCAGLNGGNAIHHFVQCITKWFTDLGLIDGINPDDLLPKLQELAEKQMNVNNTLIVRPIFFGERHNTGLAGHISGFNSTNFSDIGAIFKLLCEGVVDHLHDMVPLKFLLSRGINQLLISGSVPVNNPIVKQRLKQLYEDIAVTLDLKETDAVSSAIGAAKLVRDRTTDVRI
ncbi:unnamed protein product [Lymnaea stagnalis]|uniref:Carbohydrate kinase FGGY N-terminal domain-containing protein n=1 Tax=Lymnaea stagnalis TaxID=6523 RepID=A0AAV2IEB3_LYMST